jgi:hypothetical protein
LSPSSRRTQLGDPPPDFADDARRIGGAHVQGRRAIWLCEKTSGMMWLWFAWGAAARGQRAGARPERQPVASRASPSC